MSATSGPDIVSDGLVFYYDTGNSIDSYLGEPTTNLVTNPTFLGTPNTQTSAIADNWSFSGDTSVTGFRFYDSATSPITLKYPDEGAVITTGPNATSNRRIYFNGTVEPSTTYTLSYWVYSSNYGAITNYFFTYRADGTTAASPAYGQGIATGEWVFVQRSFTTPADTGNARSVNWGPVISSGTNSLFAIQRFQIEAKSHPTQFTTGTRSVSGSLLDLTGNSTIDLSNVSFDSNAQMTFDGTDDYVNITNSPQVLFDNDEDHSFSLWLRKAGDNSGNYAYVYDKYGTYRCPGLLFILNTNQLAVEWRKSDNTSWQLNQTGLSVETNIWNFVTVTITAPGAGSTKTIRVYLYTSSGLQTATLTNSTDWNAATDGYFHIGRSISNGTYFNGEIDLVRTYNRALTASEIKSNFNAIKGRFNIL